jgi:serine/threonine protein kinase
VTAPPLAPGSMFASRWIVGGLLGQSELGEVYEAEEAHQRRFAALKIMKPELVSEPAWSEHIALTRALSELPGDGIARAYDLGIETGKKRPYIASERITFPTLSRYVGERGPVPLRVLAQALTTLGAALDAAHAAGIMHGGIKPQNVFVSYDNPHWARLTDFSLARLRAASGQGPTALLGWSAPEAAAGFITPAGDRYALALVCFFAASGVPWYNALRSLDGPPSERSRGRLASERAKSQGGELDPAFDAWFARALAADPDARFRTASELAAVFVDVFTGAPTAQFPARSSVGPVSRTMPFAASQVPVIPAQDSGPAYAPTLPLPVDPRGSAPPPLRPSNAPPHQSFPAPHQSVAPAHQSVAPAHRSVPPAVPLVAVPRWFWFGLAGITLVALLSIWWLASE